MLVTLEYFVNGIPSFLVQPALYVCCIGAGVACQLAVGYDHHRALICQQCVPKHCAAQQAAAKKASVNRTVYKDRVVCLFYNTYHRQ